MHALPVNHLGKGCIFEPKPYRRSFAQPAFFAQNPPTSENYGGNSLTSRRRNFSYFAN